MSGRGRNAGAMVLRLTTALLVVGATLVAAPAMASDAESAARVETAATSVPAPTTAGALSGSQFNPGLIISDTLFFDSNAMTLAQIQAFLDARVPNCANQYCLADYRTSSTSKPADAYCDAFSGSSSESAASIIYRVQRACGISARAILVTLHKEQGLITKSAPTSGAIRIAMGYGCPDTAACDSTYYGFFNQVYQASRQFQRYGNPATSFTWYPVGQVSNVRYHPNAACGSQAVRIQNRATAALYYYTPYTPNAASLANLGGTGNSCSSYGNRNFWAYFSTWFGNPLAGAGDAAIAGAYNVAGSELGAAVPPLTACGTRLSCHQRYDDGAIYWMAATGAVVLKGAVWEEFAEQNYGSGTLGYPTGPEVSVTGGSGTPFQSGSIYTSPAGTFTVLKPLRDHYWANGSTSGSLGWPVADRDCSGTICAQEFQGGVVFASGATGRVMGLDYLDAFEAAGGVAGMGMPAAARVQMPSTPNGPGSGQTFTKGTILSSAAGTFAIAGTIKTAYSGVRSYLGTLGWPAGHQTCESAGCRQDFQHGAIISTGSAAYAVADDYLAVVDASTGVGALGRPLGNRVAISNRNGVGGGQVFQNGTIYSSAAGAFGVVGEMRTEYLRRGGNSGAFGFPIEAQTCTADGCTQRFQHGTLSTAPLDDSAITRYWVESGGAAGPLGAPASAIVTVPASGTNQGGMGQAFARGTVYSSDSGTFAVLVPLRTEYFAHRGNAGPLGWPTADQQCSGGECTQAFQGGVVFSSTARGGRVIETPYLALYEANRSALGVPLGDALALPSSVNGNGRGQSFVNGTIYEGAPGPFVVLRPIRDGYATAGSYNGRLGWPTGARECDGGDCAQAFQKGIVTVTAGGAVRVVDGAYATAYRDGGGFAGLGVALGDRVTVPASANGGGTGQVFQKGAIYSSTSGTYAVLATIRAEYMRLGGNGGTLGWPTSAQVCAGDECSQTFSGGAIFHSESSGTRSLIGDYARVYAEAGGRDVLGIPLGNPIVVTGNPNGNGEGQPFANGTIYKSAAGVFAVIKPLRDEYWIQGSNSGPLGWPTGPQICESGVCTQPFQGGSVTR